jgi:hypothetical protein
MKILMKVGAVMRKLDFQNYMRTFPVTLRQLPQLLIASLCANAQKLFL